MKTFIICSMILIFTSHFELTCEMELKSNSIKMQQSSSIITKNNRVIHYGLNVTNNLKYVYTINYFNGTSWELLPNEFIDTEKNKIDTFSFSKDKSNIAFDNSNNIWIASETDGYYRWNGFDYEKYQINDQFTDRRIFESIAIDSTNNIWLTTKVIIDHSLPFINYFSELYRFDGNNYKLIMLDEISTSLGFSKIFVNTDNNILAVRISNKDNLLTISQNDKIDYSVLNTPHYIIDSTKYEKRFPRVHKIVENNKELWFCLGQNDPADPGIVIRKSESIWEALDENNNYRQVHTNKGFGSKDSLFAVANGMTVDNEGKIWVGGAGFLNYLNDENMLVTPNIEDFLNKSIFYSRDIITDEGSEAPEEKINFLRNTDSIITVVKEIFNRDFSTKHLLGKTGNVGGSVEDLVYTDDGSLWISFKQLGILRYQPNYTNVENVSTSESISLYPQPVTSADKLINIEFGKMEAVSEVSIFNMAGKLILSNNYDSQLYDKIEMKLDNIDFIAGSYYATIQLKDRTIFRKFIIN